MKTTRVYLGETCIDLSTPIKNSNYLHAPPRKNPHCPTTAQKIPRHSRKSAFYVLQTIADSQQVFTLLRFYSGIFMRRTHHKADISIRRTVNLGTERFPGQTLLRKSL